MTSFFVERTLISDRFWVDRDSGIGLVVAVTLLMVRMLTNPMNH